MNNPYSPIRPPDEADVFVATLPPASLKAASICALVQGLLMLPFALRLALSLSGRTDSGRATLGAIIGFHLVLAVASIASMRMMQGRTWAAITAIVVSPLCGLVSLFGLMTGALAGLFGMFLALVTLVLAAVNIGHVRRIARARSELAKLTA